jgi:hypothetical protein
MEILTEGMSLIMLEKEKASRSGLMELDILDFGKTIFLIMKELSFRLILFIKVIGKMVKLKNTEFIRQKQLNIKETGNKISLMAMELKLGLTEIYSRDNIIMAINMGKELIDGQINQNMLENGNKGKYKGKESTNILMEVSMKEIF